MHTKDYLQIIPAQYQGAEIEAEASVELEKADPPRQFELAKQRLLHVKQWHATAGIASADFQIVDAAGKEYDRAIQKGDFMRVDIPGPGSKEGEGYDWVQVEDLKEYNEGDVQSLGFTVRPVPNPLTDKDVVAHFYDSGSTSTFIVTREGTRLSASIIDCNIKPNEEAASLTDKIRNTAVGISAIATFSKVQWQQLANGLIKAGE